jgi:SAM-dependent methyltransferase
VLNDRMRAAYDLIAPAYAEGTAGPMPPARAIVAADFAERLRVSGGRLLDLGCGPGYDLVWFAQQGVCAVGADLSPAMLEHARRAGSPLVQADMRHPPFADGAFAAVWCCASLLHVPKADLPATLAEIHRLLAPAGRLLVVLQEGKEEGWETGQWVEGVERFYSRYTIETFQAALEAASFRVLDALREPTDRRVWLRFVAERA